MRTSKYKDTQELYKNIYVNNADIQKLLCVGYDKAKAIIIEILEDMAKDNAKSLYDNRVPLKRVLRKYGLSKNDFS